VGVSAPRRTTAQRVEREYREVQLKIAARHPVGRHCRYSRKSSVLHSPPPGLTGFAGGRPQPSPVVRLFSFLLPKAEVAVRVEVEGKRCPWRRRALQRQHPCRPHRRCQCSIRHPPRHPPRHRRGRRQPR
jgi:hypothetical protein